MPITKNNSYKLKFIDLSDNTQVNSGGGTDSQDLTPKAGKIYQIYNIRYNADAPIGDTSGTHKLEIKYFDGTSYHVIAYLIGNHSTSISISSAGYTGDSVERPSAAADQYKTIWEVLHASNSYPIRFTYTNSTDAHQTGTRDLLIWVKEFNEAI